MGKFSYFVDGKSDDTQSAAFPSLVLGQHRLLRAALIDERQRREKERAGSAPAGAQIFTGLPNGLSEVAQWKTALSDIELKIQGFDLGKLLSQLRASISPPEEISGFVEKSGGLVRASMSWPGPGAASSSDNASTYETGYLANETTAALAIAAGIVWKQAAQSGSAFEKIPRDAFVAWTLAWWDLRQMRALKALSDSPSADDKKRWSQARRLVDRLLVQAPQFPEIWRLRAEIIEASFDAISDQDKAIALEDRRQYAAAISGATDVKSSANLEPIRTTNSIHAGLRVWARPVSGQSDPGFNSWVTLTALVQDPSNRVMLLLPGYAMLGARETEFAVNPAGPVIARAKASDLISISEAKDAPSVVLAPLVDKFQSSNALFGSDKLSGIGPLPATGDRIVLVTPGAYGSNVPIRKSGLARGVMDGLLTSDLFTDVGEGGAPVLDKNGLLVAMGYLQKDNESRFLPIGWIFQKPGMKLVE